MNKEMTLQRAIKIVWMFHYELTMSREDEDALEDAYFYLGDVTITKLNFPFADQAVRDIRRKAAKKSKNDG